MTISAATQTPAPAPADITLAQLGGRGRLKAMIGAKDFMSDDGGTTLVFKFQGSQKWNYVKIALADDDTYTVTFAKIARNYSVTWGEPTKQVYGNSLKRHIETETGLYLSL